MKAKVTILAGIMVFYLGSNCQSHTKTPTVMNTADTLKNRPPAVAGQFYPGDAVELRRELKSDFAKAPLPEANREVLAIISPHAGYVFSGEVAAAAFNQVDPNKEYKTIFVIACSHRNSYDGGAIYSIGNYVTPLGTVNTDLAIARKLASETSALAYDPKYHLGEHSLEVEIPFLQYHLKKDFRIVPILLGTQDLRRCEEIAKALKPYFTPDNLFLISTDFSHYPAYKDAVASDKKVADAIMTNKPSTLVRAIENCMDQNTPGLVTGCCSWPGVYILMCLTQDRKDITFKEVKYQNSGDSGYGEKDRVVGYWALTASQPARSPEEFSLSKTEKAALLSIARSTIDHYLQKHEVSEEDSAMLPVNLKRKAGVFVTLKKSGDLRGCIGHFEADQPLYKVVRQMAIASSTQDYRFPTVREEEMTKIDIEISVLTPMKKINNVHDIRLGTDGIYIKNGYRAGTFLPQVATETGWALEDFLGHCSRDKAGLGWDGWKDKDTEIFVYQALIFGEKE